MADKQAENPDGEDVPVVEEQEEAQPEDGNDDGNQEEGEPMENLMQNPNFIQFFLRMMQQEAEKKDSEKKKERKVAKPLQVAALRSRKHELRQLALDALPPLLASLGRNVWALIVNCCEARELSQLSATCWFFRALCEDDIYWEQIYAREIGGVSLVTRRCSSFRERFFLCQKMEDIVEALATAEDGDELILCPGVYERKEEDDPFGFSGLKVMSKIHILGCGFNLSFSADLNCNHPNDLPKHRRGPNIIIRSQYTNALDWRAPEGSITNVHLEYVNSDPSKYFFALKVENEFEDGDEAPGLIVKNISVTSTQQMAVSCQPSSRFTAVSCRFHASEGSGMSILEGARASVSRCIIDGNASGISISNGHVVISDSIIANNRFAGLGINGPSAVLRMSGCNVFHHPLQGVEVLSDVPLSNVTIERSHCHNNLNGILRWIPPEVDMVSVANALEVSNNVHDNRKGQVVARHMPLGKSLADMAIEANVCTFVYTGPNFIHQQIMHCNTCGMNGRAGCCVSCARTCHAGHDVVEYAESSFYCDCPSFPTFQCLHKQVVSEKPSVSPTTNWLLPNVLCGRFPSKEDVQKIKEAGVQKFVTLNEAWEYSDGQRQRAINYFAENREFFPIPDYGVPGDVTAFDSFIERLAADVKSNVTLFIHCMGGSGRTGIVAACLLLKLEPNLTGEQALDRVDKSYKSRDSHGHRSPEFDHQNEFVMQYAARRK